jgi:cysteinyl-tRNA synthetase
MVISGSCAVMMQAFFEDLGALNILPANRYPRATEHIDDIVKMVQELLER